MIESEETFVALVQQSRHTVAALVLAALWTAESVAPLFAGRARRVSHAAANFGLAAINAAVAYAFAFAILGVTE